jgi:hypothetical protein
VIAAPVGGAAGAVDHVVVVVGLSEQVGRLGLSTLARELRTLAADLTRRMGVG